MNMIRTQHNSILKLLYHFSYHCHSYLNFCFRVIKPPELHFSIFCEFFEIENPEKYFEDEERERKETKI